MCMCVHVYVWLQYILLHEPSPWRLRSNCCYGDSARIVVVTAHDSAWRVAVTTVNWMSLRSGSRKHSRHVAGSAPTDWDAGGRRFESGAAPTRRPGRALEPSELSLAMRKPDSDLSVCLRILSPYTLVPSLTSEQTNSKGTFCIRVDVFTYKYEAIMVEGDDGFHCLRSDGHATCTVDCVDHRSFYYRHTTNELHE